jgi:hypothetical protein
MLRGRCACEAVAYEVADEFVVAYNCHCSNCRAMTGSAFLPWGEIEPERLSVTKGADSLLIEGDSDASHAVRCVVSHGRTCVMRSSRSGPLHRVRRTPVRRVTAAARTCPLDLRAAIEADGDAARRRRCGRS